MSDQPDDSVPPFWRDRLAPAQRRRLEALIAVRTLYPDLEPEAAVWLARWIITGRLELEQEVDS